MMHPVLVSALVATGTWESWRWYFARVATAPEEAAALLLIVLFLGAIGFVHGRPSIQPCPLPVYSIAGLLALYAVTHAFVPPIVRAAGAAGLTLFCLHVAAFRRRPHIAFWALVALALPVVPSLQFTLGYPMRVLSASLTIALLQTHGFVVAREGTFILWRDDMVQFDAPCSGVNMLWAGLLLAMMGCTLLRFGPLQVLIAALLSVVLVIAGNVLRAASLFYIEAGLVPRAPGWWHEGVGLVAFGLTAVAILWCLARLRGREVIA